VDTGSKLQELIASLSSSACVAIDTEADSLHHYFEKVCLIQMSLAEADYIVDPLVGFPVADLMSALADKTLICHGGDYDLRMLRMSFGFEPRGEVFDTMSAAQLLGYKELGLAALVKRFFGVDLPKQGQKADWSRRPLPPNLLDYARSDTVHLWPLSDLLRAQLTRLGRSKWHREICRQMVRSSTEPHRRDSGQEWRIKGASKLSPRALTLLREFWHWRDTAAQRGDIPPFRILSNQKLLDLVSWAHANPRGRVEHWPALPRSYHGRRLVSLSAVLRKARRMPVEGVSSTHKEKHFNSNGPDNKPLVDALREKRDAVAAALGIDAAVLAPKALLQSIARARPKNIEELYRTERILAWQVDLLAGPFLQVLEADDRRNGEKPMDVGCEDASARSARAS